jgi:hypothetical protein
MSSSSSDAATAVASPTGEDEARPLDLEVSIEEVSTCQRRVKVTVPRADIDRYRDDAIGELMPSARAGHPAGWSAAASRANWPTRSAPSS